MKDIYGREYLTVAEAQSGMVVEVDGDFTCIDLGEKRSLMVNENGLYFTCKHKVHSLSGQLSDDETHYIGLYPTKYEE